MKEQLIHILDQSVCLSRKQMKEYLGGTMLPEEMHAAEIHLNACPLCSMAMDGFEAHSEDALAAIASLNSGFLKEHFDNIAPQIHLNSMAPATALTGRRHTPQLFRTASIAAGILVLFGALWYFGYAPRRQAAGALTVATTGPAPDAGRLSEEQSEAAALDEASPARMAAPVTKQDNPVQPTEPASAGHSVKQPDERTASAAEAAAKPAQPAKSPAQPVAKPENLVAARAYKAPVINPDNRAESPAEGEETKDVRNSEVVSMNTAPPASLNPVPSGVTLSGARSSGTKYTVDGVQQKPVTAKPGEKSARSQLELGNDSFDKGKYSAALRHYQQHIGSSSGRDRTQAMIMAARCYSAMGNKEKAEQLLQSVVDDGPGPDRREARRLIRSMKQ